MGNDNATGDNTKKGSEFSKEGNDKPSLSKTENSSKPKMLNKSITNQKTAKTYTKTTETSLKAFLVNFLAGAGVTMAFAIGIVVMFYPDISNYVNEKSQSRAVQSYIESVNQFDSINYEKYINDAKEYNARLANNKFAIKDAFMQGKTASDQSDEYWNLLSIDGNPVMGYVEVDSLDIKVPLYHGTNDTVLSIGAGHIQGSSLPVGGESTHTVISAHTGLPSARFFDNLDRIAEGDTFTLYVMNEILTYKVNKILVVLPEEIEALGIENGKDYATLVTCTPYGINSHRLLIRGERIETPLEEYDKIDEAYKAAIDESDRRTWAQNVQVAIAEKLSAFAEVIATAIVNIAQWFMDIIGVKYN